MDQTQLALPDFNEKFRGYDIDEVNAYLAQVGEQMAGLARERDEALQRAAYADDEVRRLREAAMAAAAAPAPAPVANDLEAASGEAARMLALASQTAERAVAEAKSEASRIISDANAAAETTQREARTEADRIVGEARVNAEQMTQKATEQAAQEYGARRDEILTEIGSLENHRSTTVTQLAAVESRIEEYRAALRSISANIEGLLEDPEKMLRPPIPGIELPTPAQFIDVHSRPVEAFAAVEQFPTSVIEPVAAPVAEGRPTFTDEAAAFEAMEDVVGTSASSAFSDPVGSYDYADTPASDYTSVSPAYVDTIDDDVTVDPASFVVEPVDTGFNPAAFTDEASVDTYEAEAFTAEAFTAESYPAASGATEAYGAEQPAAFSDPAEGDTYGGFGNYDESQPAWGEDLGGGASDTWAPGSWSEVAGFTATNDAFSAAPQADYGTDAFADPDAEPVNSATFPTGGLPSIGADRYTRELDEALNTETDDDDAMARFFEGDDDRQTRRFGRRR